LESRNFNQAVKELQPNRSKLDDDALVQLALALDGLDRSAEALEVLETRNASAGASAQLDAMGVLAGRLKRRWLAEKRKDDAERAEQFYAEGFAQAEKAQDHEMAYYLGINVAFMQLAARKDRAAARAIAEKVLAHCAAAKPGMWCSATQGEAKLVLGKTQPALQSYLHAVGSKPKPTPRQMESMYHQAMKVADLMNDTDATSGLDTIFRPS
jgi:tetratricopeptide (TPR) repeat protein